MSTREEDFDSFLGNLKKASVAISELHYFQLPVATKEGSEEVFRERVYCYELYHQLRLVLGDGYKYKLHGEVDKSGHEIIPGEKKPDFIVHDPGDMDNNLAVIEVKPVDVENHLQRLDKDLGTLRIFGEKGKYYRAIMLVYGDGCTNLPPSIKSRVVERSNSLENRILLAWHSGPNKELELIPFQQSSQRARDPDSAIE
jgi:hypothetical protein